MIQKKTFLGLSKSELALLGLAALTGCVAGCVVYNYGYTCGYFAAEKDIQESMAKNLVNNWASISITAHDADNPDISKTLVTYTRQSDLQAFGGQAMLQRLMVDERVMPK